MEESYLKNKLLIVLVVLAILVGLLSGCVEEKPKNVAPVAAINCVEAGYVDEEITFFDESTDEDGTIASWSWDMNGDDVEDSTDQNFTYTFTSEGTYTIALSVTDNDGATSDKAECMITITYEPPTAAFTYDPMENITVNVTEVTFNASSSVAGYAEITGYSWDFNADGIEDANTSEATYMFTTMGDMDVSLTVTDEMGSTDTTSETIRVIEEVTV